MRVWYVEPGLLKEHTGNNPYMKARINKSAKGVAVIEKAHFDEAMKVVAKLQGQLDGKEALVAPVIEQATNE